MAETKCYPVFGEIVTRRIAPTGGRHRAIYELVEPMLIQVAEGEAWSEVPAGFLTNFASTEPFDWLYPPDGPWGPAAVWHDYLYSLDGYPRHVADAWFLAGMKSLGVPWWRRWIMYLAVRLFGGFVRRSA